VFPPIGQFPYFRAMVPRFIVTTVLVLIMSSLFAQEKFTVLKDIRSEWQSYEKGSYEPVLELPFSGLNTIYFQLDPREYNGAYLAVSSLKPYFLFVNGKVCGEFSGSSVFRIDSLLMMEGRVSWIA